MVAEAAAEKIKEHYLPAPPSHNYSGPTANARFLWTVLRHWLQSKTMSDGPVEREDSWVLLEGLDFEHAGEYAASPPGGRLPFNASDEPPPYNASVYDALVPQQHQGALTTDQHRALQVALQCATAAVESDAAMDAERARYFYIKAANTLSALG
eukprot:gene3550-11039_t